MRPLAFFGVLRRLAQVIDTTPLSPQRAAEFTVSAFHSRRARRAATDPTWSAIEDRRRVPGSKIKKLVSEDLDLATMNKQRSIARDLTPDPWWLPAVTRLAAFRMTEIVEQAEFAIQRVRHGYDRRSTWDLGHHLATTFANQLDTLADNAHGWPESDEFPTFEDWTAALRATAANLRRYNGSTELETATDTWIALSSDPGALPAEREAAMQKVADIEAADLAAAQAALRWVADHLAQLWD